MLLTHIAFYVLFCYLNNTKHFKFFKLKFHAININDFIYNFFVGYYEFTCKALCCSFDFTLYVLILFLYINVNICVYVYFFRMSSIPNEKKEDSYLVFRQNQKVNFKCVECFRNFSSKRSVLRHLNTAHDFSKLI